MIIDKEFSTIKERNDWLVSNKNSLIAQKKAQFKTADAVSWITPVYDKAENEYKANNPITDFRSLDEIKVMAVINTTNVIDSHMDLHVKGIWNKSVKENKNIMHLQEHKMNFDSIIADGSDLKASVKDYTWVELGYSFEGNTQALVFESTVKADRNAKMFEQYAKGYVKNHSVGMQYMKLLLAVNDDRFEEEKQTWDKYINLAINPDVAEESGYFFVVLEAKAIEGSAVPIGSNQLTPTLENNKEAAIDSTSRDKEPSTDTHLVDKLNELLTKI